jgi:CheY-like chemotaxis protein
MDFHVIFVNQPSDDENNEILQNIFDNKGILGYTPSLQDLHFCIVHIVTSIKDAMLSIHSKDQKPTIVLIDIDHYFSFFEKLCQSIQYYNHHIIPIGNPFVTFMVIHRLNFLRTGLFIACSKSDSTSLMIQAIQIGASDFILKPFREPVLKTMFLVRKPIMIRFLIAESLVLACISTSTAIS